MLGTVQPGSKLALPYGFDASGKQLLVRFHVLQISWKQRVYSNTVTTTDGAAFISVMSQC